MVLIDRSNNVELWWRSDEGAFSQPRDGTIRLETETSA
jgi:hypothetical protein